MDAIAILELIKTIGGALSTLLTVSAVVTLLVKPVREKFTKWVNKTANTQEFENKFKDINDKIDRLTELVKKTIEQNEKLQDDIDNLCEATQASLRNQILILYYDCRKKKYITSYELECLDKLYKNYTELKGNHFIKTCYIYLTTQMEVRDD